MPVGPPSRTWACARPPPAPACCVWRSHSVLTLGQAARRAEHGALGPTALPLRDTAVRFVLLWISCGLVGLGAPASTLPKCPP